MQLDRSSALVPRLEFLASTGSTNDVIRERAEDESWPQFSVVATLDQTAGRGRLGRTWIAPRGETLAVSVLLRPVDHGLSLDHFSWLPLLAGLAMTEALAPIVGGSRTTLKWPNDVLIDDRKVCGILVELVSGAAVIVGAGVNLTLDEDELPVPTATSLKIAGAERPAGDLVDEVLSSYLGALTTIVGQFIQAAGDVEASGLRNRVAQRCDTIGRRVRVELPDGTTQLGKAIGIDETGRLVVSRDGDGAALAVSAGDVTHVRYA